MDGWPFVAWSKLRPVGYISRRTETSSAQSHCHSRQDHGVRRTVKILSTSVRLSTKMRGSPDCKMGYEDEVCGVLPRIPRQHAADRREGASRGRPERIARPR